MRSLAFATRNVKEILRDPLSIVFGVGFPVALILLMSLINESIGQTPVDIFGIENLTPGIAVFGLSFLSLFLAMLMANDKSSAFLTRLFASPLTARDYVIGYSLPLLPIAILQGAICFLTAFLFGLPISMKILLAMIVLIPIAGLFVSFGLLLGGLLTTGSQAGGIGSILINAAAWLSGTWFDLDMIGGAFKTLCSVLPFAHAVDAVRAALTGDYASIIPHLHWVIVYTVVIFFIATRVFKVKMKG